MTLSAFDFTARARPIIEVGLGDSRIDTPGAHWDVQRWDASDALWANVEPTWRDIACDTISWRCEYGRQRVTDRFVPGTATVVVDNHTGWADPYAVTSPSDLRMRPGRSIRMGVWHVDYGTVWLFRGFVDAMEPVYDPIEPDTVTLQCIDALGEVNRAKLTPVEPTHAGDSVDVRVNRLLDAALWPAAARDIWFDGDRLIATSMGGQLADLLGQAADSAGGSIWGDREGRVAYRHADWQTFMSGTPVDATIGNVEKGQPGYWIPGTPGADGYLTPSVGTVTTPDFGPVPTQYHFVFDAVMPTGLAAGFYDAAAQFNDGGFEWRFGREGAANAGTWGIIVYPSNTTSPVQVVYVNQSNTTPPTGVRERVAATFDRQASQTAARLYKPDASGAWVADQPTRTTAATTQTLVDGTTKLRVGNSGGGSRPWPGRLYSIEMRTGLTPGAGTLLWRFDANDYPGGAVTSYTDPRGRVWTLTAGAAITPKVPAVPDVWVPPVPADICPVQWERPFNRADIATRVIIGRDAETAQTFDDVPGQTLYGIEPFERVDLLNESDTALADLGRRILRVRSATTAPRIRSVTLNAVTAENALDLMTTADVFRPSRYRCRLRYPRGDVFDAEHFATALVHEVTSSSWTLNMNLDLAAPFAATGGRWDQNTGWDYTLWSTVAALLDELRQEGAAA